MVKKIEESGDLIAKTIMAQIRALDHSAFARWGAKMFVGGGRGKGDLIMEDPFDGFLKFMVRGAKQVIIYLTYNDDYSIKVFKTNNDAMIKVLYNTDMIYVEQLVETIDRALGFGE